MFERLDIFYGRATVSSAVVYVRLAQGWDEADCLDGVVEGPFGEVIRTLPATMALRDAGPGESLLAAAQVADPCFWSPDSPLWYEARVQLRRDGLVVGRGQQRLGLRATGVKGNSFYVAGRRWVIRGVRETAVRTADAADWREAGAVLTTRNLSDELLDAASRLGVWVIADLQDQRPDDALLRRLSHHPAVAMLVLDDWSEPGCYSATNLLKAQRKPREEHGDWLPAAWADCVWDVVDDAASFAARHEAHGLPVIAERPDSGQSVGEARRAVDVLQRDLAPHGEFAGFVV